jgi:hypothetical protein
VTAVAKTWPYRTGSRTRLTAGHWRLTRGAADPVDLEEALDDWDATVNLRLRRSLVLDAAGIAQDCGLAEGTPLRVMAVWRASGTSARGVGTCREVVAEGRQEIDVQVEVDGAELGRDLHLSVAVVLGTTLPPRAITAWRQGSVLWEDAVTLRLEGGGSRFPIEEVSFPDSGIDFPDRAAWRLVWEADDLELPVLGSVRLFLNREHPTVRMMLDHPERPDSRLVTAFMMFDVTRALVRGAVCGEAFCTRDRPWPADSVGRVVDRILKVHFRGATPGSLRQMALQDPERFDAVLQDRLGLLRMAPK